jgi:protein deglycase
MEVVGLTDVLARGGVRVTIADVDGDEDHLVTLANGLEIVADKSIYNCGDDAFDLIVVAGGTGAKTLADCSLLIKMLHAQKTAGKWFGGICAGSFDVLLHHALVTGPMTCYPKDAAKAGELYRDAAVVVSANCVTSQGPATAVPMALKLVELLRGENTAYDVAAAMACPSTQS